jgi:hypothetical protein
MVAVFTTYRSCTTVLNSEQEVNNESITEAKLALMWNFDASSRRSWAWSCCSLTVVLLGLISLAGCRQKAGEQGGNIGIVERVKYLKEEDTTEVAFMGELGGQRFEVFCGNREADFRPHYLYALSDQLYKDLFGQRECYEIKTLESWPAALSDVRLAVVGGRVNRVTRSSSNPQAISVEFLSQTNQVTTVSLCDSTTHHYDLSRALVEGNTAGVRYDPGKYSNGLGCYIVYAAWRSS